MMRITLSPQRRDDNLAVLKKGEVFTINGEEIDLSSVAEGFPAEVDTDWIPGTISREDGELHFTLIVPFGPDSPAETMFPADLVDPADGILPASLKWEA